MKDWNKKYELTTLLQEATELDEMGRMVDLGPQQEKHVKQFFRKNFKKIVLFFKERGFFNWLSTKLKKINVDELIKKYLIDKVFRKDLHSTFKELADIDNEFKKASDMQLGIISI